MDIGQPDFDRTYDSKTGCGEHLEPTDQSQPSLTIYYTIMVRQWKGQDAVKCLNQSTHSPFGCET